MHKWHSSKYHKCPAQLGLFFGLELQPQLPSQITQSKILVEQDIERVWFKQTIKPKESSEVLGVFALYEQCSLLGQAPARAQDIEAGRILFRHHMTAS